MENKKIFVQTFPGSFTHQALSALQKRSLQEISADPNIEFCGSQLQAMIMAEKNSGNVFLALKNKIIGNINTTVEALKEYEILEALHFIQHKVSFCVIRTKNAVEKNIPFQKIISHPAGITQTQKWQNLHNISPENIYEEIEGTAEGARRLSMNECDDTYAVIGPETLTRYYKNLIVTEKNIEDEPEDYTVFGLLKTQKRNSPISKEEANQHLEKVLTPKFF